MTSRLHVALPATLTFFFGLAFGLVAGRVLWAPGSRPQEAVAAPTPDGEAHQHDDGSAPVGHHDDPEALRRNLAAHEALLAKSPEDVGLMRMVANYHGLLGENDEALAIYAKAEALARTQGATTQLVDILTDEGVVLAEVGRYDEGFAKLAEAKATVPLDTRSRLTEAMILLNRIMQAPPPGWDRKMAVEKAEALLREVLTIDPNEPNATEMLAMITSIRTAMARGSKPLDPAAMGESPAPPVAVGESR